MRNISDENFRENQNTYFMLIFFFRKSIFFSDNVEKYCRAGHAPHDNIIPRMRIACWIPKATDTRSEHVTLIAFPLQQWLHERASLLRCTYIARFVYISCDVIDI